MAIVRRALLRDGASSPPVPVAAMGMLSPCAPSPRVTGSRSASGSTSKASIGAHPERKLERPWHDAGVAVIVLRKSLIQRDEAEDGEARYTLHEWARRMTQ
jgi:hypothetical protein